MTDAALHYPSTIRNRDAILDVLRRCLPESGTVLEIASGSGEHGVYFAGAFPGLAWQPSDPDATALASIAAWRDKSGVTNLLPPLHVDAAASLWPVTAVDALVCINMIHISPWAATVGLMAGAGRILPSGGMLYTYGPFREADRPTAPSNLAFDESLKSRNPDWGLRQIGAVSAEAAKHGLSLVERVEMPANNLSLVFRKD